jgi:hypothetical protein
MIGCRGQGGSAFRHQKRTGDEIKNVVETFSVAALQISGLRSPASLNHEISVRNGSGIRARKLEDDYESEKQDITNKINGSNHLKKIGAHSRT